MTSGNQVKETGRISLRPVTPEDEALLFAIYCSSREQEMAMIPWDDAQKEVFLRSQFTAQTNHYRDYYQGSEHSIIVAEGTSVGRVQIVREETILRILDITVLTRYRGKGIGTPVIRGLMNEAAAKNIPVCIHVETFSPSAGLFQRLGFAVKENDGVNFLFEWNGNVDIARP